MLQQNWKKITQGLFDVFSFLSLSLRSPLICGVNYVWPFVYSILSVIIRLRFEKWSKGNEGEAMSLDEIMKQ